MMIRDRSCTEDRRAFRLGNSPIYKYSFVILTILFCLPLCANYVTEASSNSTELTIYLPDQEPVFISGRPRMITGVINVIDVSYTGEGSVSLTMYHGETEPDDKTKENYYQWGYDGDGFYCLYGDFIDLEKSSIQDNKLSLHAGTIVTAELGLWTAIVVGTETETYQIEMDIPKAGIGLSAPDYFFSTSPFSGEYFYSSDRRQHFRTINNGNIPMRLEVDYDIMGEYISTTNTTGVLDMGEERYHHLTFATPIWGPRRVEISASVRGVPHIEPITPATIQLIQLPQFTFSVTIEIVRPGFRLLELGDVIVQYRPEASVGFLNTTTLELYMSGDTRVSLTTSTSRLSLESTVFNEQERGSSFNVPLASDREDLITYTVKGIEANAVGELTYILQWGNHTEHITTEVTTGPAPEGYTEDDSSRNIIGLAFVILTIVVALLLLVIFSRKKRPEETAKERKRREWLERHKGKDK